MKFINHKWRPKRVKNIIFINSFTRDVFFHEGYKSVLRKPQRRLVFFGSKSLIEAGRATSWNKTSRLTAPPRRVRNSLSAQQQNIPLQKQSISIETEDVPPVTTSRPFPVVFHLTLKVQIIKLINAKVIQNTYKLMLNTAPELGFKNILQSLQSQRDLSWALRSMQLPVETPELHWQPDTCPPTEAPPFWGLTL